MILTEIDYNDILEEILVLKEMNTNPVKLLRLEEDVKEYELIQQKIQTLTKELHSFGILPLEQNDVEQLTVIELIDICNTSNLTLTLTIEE